MEGRRYLEDRTKGSPSRTSPRGDRPNRKHDRKDSYCCSCGLLSKMLVSFILFLLAQTAMVALWTPKEGGAYDRTKSDLLLVSVLKSNLRLAPQKKEVKVFHQDSQESTPAALTDNNNNNNNNNHRKTVPSDLLELYKKERDAAVQHINCPPSLLQSSYGPSVTCNLTVVRMDPRLESQRLWSLESIAFYNPDACVALLTTACGSEQHTRDTIYSHALPLFKKMIESQRVRVAFLDRHQPRRYVNLIDTCRSIANPTAVLMHHNFWVDEFTQQDSDRVLIMQDDSALCRPLRYDFSWAYAGAPWPPNPSTIFPYPQEGKCMELQSKYKNMRQSLQQQWSFTTQNNQNNQNNTLSTGDLPPPPSQLSRDSLDLLQNCTQGIIGNGGFSLRSRAWMKRVIQLCPHRSDSGIDWNSQKNHHHQYHCISDEPNEDIYFVAVLYGVEAPLPTPLQAAEFAVEGLFLEDFLAGRLNTDAEYLGAGAIGTTTTNTLPDADITQPQEEDASSTSLSTSKHQILIQGKKLTVPIGFHKPWWYIPKSILLSSEMEEACPFLQFLFKPEDAKY